MSKYVSEFHNIILEIPDKLNGKVDRFCTSLKYQIHTEELKSAVMKFLEATSVALSIDSALWTAEKVEFSATKKNSLEAIVQMETGNFKASEGKDLQ